MLAKKVRKQGREDIENVVVKFTSLEICTYMVHFSIPRVEMSVIGVVGCYLL